MLSSLTRFKLSFNTSRLKSLKEQNTNRKDFSSPPYLHCLAPMAHSKTLLRSVFSLAHPLMSDLPYECERMILLNIDLGIGNKIRIDSYNKKIEVYLPVWSFKPLTSILYTNFMQHDIRQLSYIIF